MKKKGIITTVAALTLTAIVGIGATLAYLSDKTNELTNTFTIGAGIDIKLDEAKVVNNEPVGTERTETGNSYTDLFPGQEVKKDPTTTVVKCSNPCYVFMKVTGIDKLEEVQTDSNPAVQAFTVSGFNADNWVRVQGEEGKKDGIYRYKEAVSDAKALDPLFTSVKYANEGNGSETPAEGGFSNIKVQSAAIQSEGFADGDAALTEVTGLFTI